MLSFIRSHVSAKRERDAAQEAASRRIENRFDSLASTGEPGDDPTGSLVVGPRPVSVTRHGRTIDLA
ncbi:hypothetical protein [Rubellimicrobium roseum]|uniref:Uncharacterized protein n=1 Tax=Rubellimicrobium roseum TaxID=687525 RepID=A0A5C4NLS0_9RHOB|nr:hypothetical protein [Rubellimicrobium roseum]TNC73359.1 hypothetical protein FHG71_05815 [Rubellimicrobium roseum]